MKSATGPSFDPNNELKRDWLWDAPAGAPAVPLTTLSMESVHPPWLWPCLTILYKSVAPLGDALAFPMREPRSAGNVARNADSVFSGLSPTVLLIWPIVCGDS